MPVTIKKLPGGGARVSTPNMVHAKHTSMQKAMAQKRLLSAVEHGWTPGRRHSKGLKMPMTAKPMKPKGMKKKTDGMDDM